VLGIKIQDPPLHEGLDTKNGREKKYLGKKVEKRERIGRDGRGGNRLKTRQKPLRNRGKPKQGT